MTNLANTTGMAELRVFNVPENVKKAIKMLALERDSTMNAEIIRALEFYLANQKSKK